MSTSVGKAGLVNRAYTLRRDTQGGKGINAITTYLANKISQTNLSEQCGVRYCSQIDLLSLIVTVPETALRDSSKRGQEGRVGSKNLHTLLNESCSQVL